MKLSIAQYMDDLVGMTLFRDIDRDDLASVLTCLGAFTKTYEKEEYIYLQDEEILSVGVVLSGTVEMIREDAWGNRALLMRLTKGELFGETFACGGLHNRLVSFMAHDKTTVLFAPFKRAINSCAQSCDFHRKLIENIVVAIAEKNVQLMEKVDIISKKTLREKISEYLTLQAEYHGSSRFEIPLGRIQLAEYLNADRSALTRELNLMASEGLIEFSRNDFRIVKRLIS